MELDPDAENRGSDAGRSALPNTTAASDWSPSILVISDDECVRTAVTRALASGATQITETETGSTGIGRASQISPEVVIVDAALADLPALLVCRTIRASSLMPIVMLSWRTAEAEKVAALNAGADDYIVLPFGAREFAARVSVQLRHAAALRAKDLAPMKLAEVQIDFTRRHVMRADVPVPVTALEWRLLRVLATSAGHTLTHREIFAAVWERSFGDAQKYLRVHIAKLRRKIEPQSAVPRLIVTEPGVGYRFERPA